MNRRPRLARRAPIRDRMNLTKPEALLQMGETIVAEHLGTRGIGAVTGPIPVEAAFSAERYEQERERIFRRAWLYMAREEELPAPGDYRVKELPVLGTSLLLIRSDDGTLRAFHNICKHRGNRLLAAPGYGHARRLACGFHSWTYDCGGALAYVPDEAAFGGLDKARLGLVPIALDTWNGFVFVNAQEKPHKSLAEYLGPLDAAFRDFPYAGMRRIARYGATIKTNWKVAISAFNEAYHVVGVHARTFLPDFVTRDNPFGHPGALALHDLHQTVSIQGNYEVELLPAQALALRHGKIFGGNDLGASIPGTNPYRIDNWAFDLNLVFPSFMLFVGNGWYFNHNWVPTARDQTEWEMNVYQLPGSSAGEQVAQEYTKLFIRDGLFEDLSVLESTYAGLRTGVLKEMQINQHEAAVGHLFRTAEAIARGAIDI